jgi:hypothetical protein
MDDCCTYLLTHHNQEYFQNYVLEQNIVPTPKEYASIYAEFGWDVVETILSQNNTTISSEFCAYLIGQPKTEAVADYAFRHDSKDLSESDAYICTKIVIVHGSLLQFMSLVCKKWVPHTTQCEWAMDAHRIDMCTQILRKIDDVPTSLLVKSTTMPNLEYYNACTQGRTVFLTLRSALRILHLGSIECIRGLWDRFLESFSPSDMILNVLHNKGITGETILHFWNLNPIDHMGGLIACIVGFAHESRVLELLSYVHDHGQLLNARVLECAIVAKRSTEVFDWLFDKKCPMDAHVYNQCIRCGNRSVLRRLRDNNCPSDDRSVFENIVHCMQRPPLYINKTYCYHTLRGILNDTHQPC